VSDFRPEPRDDYEWAARTPAREAEPVYEGYNPIQSGGFGFGALARRAWAVLLAVGLAALKFGAFIVKFFGIFISVGGYALIWGWKFAVGFVLLILVHEMGHYIEARRQGLHPALPVFVPFLGAYVAIKDSPLDPWRNGLVGLAGPVFGAIGAAACWAVGDATDSRLLVALAYSGFLLNLINLLPFSILDGAIIWRGVRALWAESHGAVLVAGGGAAVASASPSAARMRAVILGGLYIGLAAALVFGMLHAHVPQSRL
jgi:Zn-dependent protease